jgi:outer membrane protein TolC
MRKRADAIFLLLALSLAAGARAQDTMRLSLREAVQVALRQNPQVQIAMLNTAQSQQDALIARSALLPQVTLDGLERVQRLNLEAVLGRRFPGLPQHAGPFAIFQAGPNFSFPVFDLSLLRRWQASRHGAHASEAQQQTVREQVVLLVVSQYQAGLRAAADVQAAESRVQLAQALYDQAADLQRAGVGTGIDTLRANVQLQNERQRLIIARTQLKTSLYGLARLLNLDPRAEVALTDQVSFFETPAFGAEQSIERALEARPEIQALKFREQAVELQKKASGDSRLPSLRGLGGWAYMGLRPNNSIPSYQYQAVVDIPVFSGGRIRAETARADLELKKIAAQRQDLSAQIALEVKTALEVLLAGRSEVEVAGLGVNLAQEEVGQARDRFQAGVANNIEVINAQNELARANDNQIAALYRYNQARAQLAHATGQIQALYVK